MEKFKKQQKALFKQFFESKILPELKECDVLYYGMGVHGIDCNESYDYLPSHLEYRICDFLEEVFPFYTKELCPIYIFASILDLPTNTQKHSTSECEKISVKEYKDLYM